MGSVVDGCHPALVSLVVVEDLTECAARNGLALNCCPTEKVAPTAWQRPLCGGPISPSETNSSKSSGVNVDTSPPLNVPGAKCRERQHYRSSARNDARTSDGVVLADPDAGKPEVRGDYQQVLLTLVGASSEDELLRRPRLQRHDRRHRPALAAHRDRLPVNAGVVTALVGWMTPAG
jgi:hypothetical protein